MATVGFKGLTLSVQQL